MVATSRTRSRVPAFTRSGSESAREAVASDTPAARATSLSLGLVRGVIGRHSSTRAGHHENACSRFLLRRSLTMKNRLNSVCKRFHSMTPGEDSMVRIRELLKGFVALALGVALA